MTQSADEQMQEVAGRLRQTPGIAEQLPEREGRMARAALEGASVFDIAQQEGITEAAVWTALGNAARLAAGQAPASRVETAGLGSDTDPGVSGGYGDTGFGAIGNDGPMPVLGEPGESGAPPDEPGAPG
jgi:hypothetical protein